MLQLNIGDRVRHKTTGIKGKVIGYGYRQISDGYYLTTVKVELPSHESLEPIAEDLFCRWEIWHEDKILVYSLPDSTSSSKLAIKSLHI
ncbi:hypothetical protein [Myxosarcina sp. GI1]|uniref:hypothetical protein n=1 Tax=Myxosarcina sp. GI1 TaxID=1541065 RepID=UPI00055EDF24|nr:hypothetical protein [Myxosarcina sp. GI1]